MSETNLKISALTDSIGKVQSSVNAAIQSAAESQNKTMTAQATQIAGLSGEVAKLVALIQAQGAQGVQRKRVSVRKRAMTKRNCRAATRGLRQRWQLLQCRAAEKHDLAPLRKQLHWHVSQARRRQVK